MLAIAKLRNIKLTAEQRIRAYAGIGALKILKTQGLIDFSMRLYL